MKQKKCKICKENFTPLRSLQMVCSPKCGFEYSKQQTLKSWNKEKKVKKENLQTVQELMKLTQIIFNKWIRERDKGQPCISCGNTKPKKVNAGHFVASGKSKFLTFNEDNVHLQCEYCNTHLHGNLIDYRINLINKIGLERVEWLEANRHETKKYTREELKEIKKKYR